MVIPTEMLVPQMQDTAHFHKTVIRRIAATLILTVVSVLAWHLSAGAAFAAEEPVWVEATGESVGSDLEAAVEVFQRAKMDAERTAVESAVGVFVRSHTLVSNGQLAEDMVFARVRGRIEKVEVVEQERDRNDPNRFRVKIKALVRPVYPDAAEGIRIKAALSRENLQEGDPVELHYQVSADSYVYLFVIGADNSVTQLLPNSRVRDNFVRANRQAIFPPREAGIKLTAMLLPESKGKGAVEKIKIIATRQEEPLLSSGFQEGFKVYDAKSTGLVSDLLKRLMQIDPADWGEVTVSYRIMPQGD
ncbi:DUF4384 domain-containing protein [Geomesophilobacter sediminis]|uniref:DUF4384 domain-containing protein n=1 Tax=Geomesophilobacter sediminis TaxID=2798584 RepID=A0A8J7IYI9_9BACT|nr:DUF4384 domain-containing protein [Geomesophilobacter sediminis]MBJ6725252.1 DUF4384 domain-containing protein [Geomesophilobacter sediminis]